MEKDDILSTPDAVDYVNKLIRELKPNNPAAVQKGWRQLRRYVKELEKKFGEGWEMFLDTYPMP
ncbi:MAG: hypothetical protein HC896_01835 [Bacteroidales bacterium]|nr:hypothetical protein [Bacteroidales bacterium]